MSAREKMDEMEEQHAKFRQEHGCEPAYWVLSKEARQAIQTIHSLPPEDKFPEGTRFTWVGVPIIPLEEAIIIK